MNHINLGKRTFKLEDSFIKQYETKKPPFGFNGLGELTYIRTYSRLKIDGQNEKWFETIRRVVEGTYSIQKNHINYYGLGWSEEHAQRSAEEMYDLMFEMKFLPPGRGLWAMGTDIIEKRGLFAALNNCAFISTDNLAKDLAKPFEFLMDMSMLGVGVGFDVAGAGTIEIKQPKENINEIVYQIEDSREGWVKSVKLLLLGYFKGSVIPNMDYSIIRKKGEPIKIFGGTASGPGPLKHLHKQLHKILSKSVGKPISIRNIVDIMNLIGQCVVAGGVRRTAEISFGPSSSEYLTLKNYYWDAGKGQFVGAMAERADFGWTSNNSIFAQLGQDYSIVGAQTAVNGEPGYAWLENMQKFGRMIDPPNWKDKRAKGGNPCIIGSTLIAVADGRNAVPIKDLIDTQYPVYTIKDKKVIIGKSIKTWKTRENAEIWKLILDDGSSLIATPDHQIMLRNGEYKELKNLIPGESLMPFNSYISNNRYRQISSNSRRDRRQYRMIAEYNNMIVNAKTTAIHHRDFDSFNDCFENFQAMSHEQHRSLHSERMKGEKNPVHRLTEEQKSKNIFYGDKHGENNPMFGKRQSEDTKQLIGEKSKQNWENQSSLMKNAIKEGMNKPEVRKKLSDARKNKLQKDEMYNHKVVSVEFYGYDDVYDMTVEDTNNFGIISSHQDDRYITSSGIFIHNCLEQTLESYELCCLVENFINGITSLEEFLRVLKFSYLYAKTVTLGQTHWEETNRVMLRNRRIGTSLSGIVQTINKIGIDEFVKWCDSGYNKIQEYDEIYSDWLCIVKSIKTTSVKPSGTISLLRGATPGMHFPEDIYCIRRIRILKTSDLIDKCIKAGYVVEPDVVDQSVMVVEIPIMFENVDRTVDQVSIWEQVSLAALLQAYWADNQVSCTVTFKPDLTQDEENKFQELHCTDDEYVKLFQKKFSSEASQIPHILNHFQYQLKGISFLPKMEKGVYAQMPYEGITEKRYNDLMKNITQIDFSGLGEDSVPERFCTNDHCTI